MAWTDIKSKALHTLNHATQEADRFAKINQEKRTLQTTQQTMHALFTETGQSIYQARQDLPNVSPAILDLFTQLESLEKQVTDIQQRITDLSAPPSPSPSSEAPETTLCSHCQTPVDLHAKFCGNCGQPTDH